jgi:hypothetical protein
VKRETQDGLFDSRDQSGNEAAVAHTASVMAATVDTDEASHVKADRIAEATMSTQVAPDYEAEAVITDSGGAERDNAEPMNEGGSGDDGNGEDVSLTAVDGQPSDVEGCSNAGPINIEARLARQGSGSVFVAPTVDGEFSLPLGQIKDWQRGFRSTPDPTRRDYRAIREAVKAPENLPPVVVMPIGNEMVVIDGALRVGLLREHHGAESNVSVRAVLFGGSEDEAIRDQILTKMCSGAMTPRERARLADEGFKSLDLNKIGFAGFLGVTNSKLTRMLTCAAVDTAYPQFFAVLKNPLKAPEDYGYEIGKAVAAAQKIDRDKPPRGKKIGALEKLLASCATVLAQPERFDPAAALAKLGIARTTSLAKPQRSEDERPRKVVTLSMEPIMMGDTTVGAIEIHADHVPRARLPEKLLELSFGDYNLVSEAWLESMRAYFDQHRPKA